MIYWISWHLSPHTLFAKMLHRFTLSEVMFHSYVLLLNFMIIANHCPVSETWKILKIYSKDIQIPMHRNRTFIRVFFLLNFTTFRFFALQCHKWRNFLFVHKLSWKSKQSKKCLAWIKVVKVIKNELFFGKTYKSYY